MAFLGSWSAASPVDAGRWLRRATVPWWIAGGWALDLYLGHQTRPHADLDVGCFRADLPSLRDTLAGWEFHVALDGSLRRLGPREAPRAHEYGLWCRPEGSPTWQLEILLESRDGGDWIFRRDASIRLRADELTRVADDGTPFVRPEVQLLYKAGRTREKDLADAAAVLPQLDREAREWLCAVLTRLLPGHPWIALAGDGALPQASHSGATLSGVPRPSSTSERRLSRK
jgi:hypothetical protein